MPRGPVIILVLVVLGISGAVAYGPRMLRILVGNPHRTTVEVHEAALEDVPLAEGKDGETEWKLVISLTFTCSTRHKPESLADHRLLDWRQQPVYIDWELEGEWTDHEERGEATMKLRDVYLPPTFRKGTLYLGEEELCPFEVKGSLLDKANKKEKKKRKRR